MDLITVEISDRGNWLDTFTEIKHWIKNQTPEMRPYRESDGDFAIDHWGFCFGAETIIIRFADPKVATLFKLTWA